MGSEAVSKEDCLRAASDGDVETLRRFLLLAPEKHRTQKKEKETEAEADAASPEAPPTAVSRRVSRELVLSLFSAAIENGQCAVVDALLSPSVRAVAYVGVDALSELLALAVVEDHEPIVSSLLKNGADVNAVTALGSEEDDDEELQPLLHLATQLGSVDLVQRLVDHGADVHARRDRDGATALHVAARQDEPEVVLLLVKHGADVNAADRERGESPLHVAAKRGAMSAAKALVSCGADLSRRNGLGSTPCRLAELEGHRELPSLLQQSVSSHGGRK